MKVKQSKFDGGHADDIRATTTNQCEYSLNFDLYTNPYKLLPIRDSVDETVDSGTMSQIELSDVVTSLISTENYITAFGYESSVSSTPTAYIRTSGMNGQWTKQSTGTGYLQHNTGTIYQGSAYCISQTIGTQYKLFKYVGGVSLTDIGTLILGAAAVGAGHRPPRPFVHPSDKKLYFAVGNVIGQYDGTNFYYYGSGISLKLPSTYEITSLTDYGDYLAIAMKDRNGIGKSEVYLWDRNLTLVDANSVINFGDGDLNVIENIDNTLVGLVYPKYFAGYSSVIKNKLDIKLYSGSAVQTIKSIDLGSQSNYNNIKLKKDNKLYFGSGYTETNIWCVYKNKEGFWTVNKERFLQDGVVTVNQIYSLNAVGDYFYIGFIGNDSLSHLRATLTSATFFKTSIYKTLINPSMPLNDRNSKKELKSFKVYFTGKTSGNITVKYLVDGKNSSDATTFETILSETTTAIESYKNATQLADSKAFASGVEYQFQLESTGGVEIKSYEYEYNVIND